MSDVAITDWTSLNPLGPSGGRGNQNKEIWLKSHMLAEWGFYTNTQYLKFCKKCRLNQVNPSRNSRDILGSAKPPFSNFPAKEIGSWVCQWWGSCWAVTKWVSAASAVLMRRGMRVSLCSLNRCLGLPAPFLARSYLTNLSQAIL